MLSLSVVVCAHNPHLARLVRTLDGLMAQSLNRAQWELLVIDNASQDQTVFDQLDLTWHPHARVVREAKLGLTAARLRGFAETTGEIIVLVDDDNVLAPDYLTVVLETFNTDGSLGATGGRSIPEFQTPPPQWMREFDDLLALRDPGDEPLRTAWAGNAARNYPACSPIGAGLAMRRSGAVAYHKALAQDARRQAFDRTGKQLTSGGDNDLVMTVLETGLAVSYVPALRLTHLIPTGRLQRSYLGALNRAIARSWVRVLALHGIRPWTPVPRGSVPLRQARSWLRNRAWTGNAAWVKWQGNCGHFEGLADLNQQS